MKSKQQQTNEAVADISRAHRADELLNNPLHIEAITAMQAAIFEEFNNTKFKDKEEREELWRRMQTVKQHLGRYESIVKQGKKAQETISLLEKGKQLINRI